MHKALAALVAFVVAVALGLAVPTSATAAALPLPVVLSARAVPDVLPLGGGPTVVTGAVKNAASCQLVLLSRQSFPVVYSHNPTTECSDGSFFANVVIGANLSGIKRIVAFALVARNGPFSFSGRFYVLLAPRLAPAVLSVHATPGALPAAGGPVQVSGTVRNAVSCQLVLLSHQSFPVVYSHNPTTACSHGTFSAHVVIGANPTAVTRIVAFTLVARNGPFSFAGPFYVSLTARTKPVPPPPPPPPRIVTKGPYTAGSTGYDVSWPQCAKTGSATTKVLPAGPSFAVVGVNNGTISGFNSCFAAEAAWAGSNLSVYIILQPAPAGTPVAYEADGPEASCAATSSECEGYDWGYNYARADIAFVSAEGLSPRAWWLDVETSEGWPTAGVFQPVNAAIVQGALAAIQQAGDVGGIYCTWYQWGRITGSYVPSGHPPIWVAGAGALSGGYYSAQAYCVRAASPGDPSSLGSAAIGFADGVPWLVQYGYGGGSPTPIDSDYSCP